MQFWHQVTNFSGDNLKTQVTKSSRAAWSVIYVKIDFCLALASLTLGCEISVKNVGEVRNDANIFYGSIEEPIFL